MNSISIPLIDITNVEKISVESLLDKMVCNGKYLVYEYLSGPDRTPECDNNIIFLDNYMDFYNYIIEACENMDDITQIYYNPKNKLSNNRRFCDIYISGRIFNREFVADYKITNLTKSQNRDLKKKIGAAIDKMNNVGDRDNI